MASCYSRNRYYQQSNDVALRLKMIACGDEASYSRRPQRATPAWRPHGAIHAEVAPTPLWMFATMHECGHYIASPPAALHGATPHER